MKSIIFKMVFLSCTSFTLLANDVFGQRPQTPIMGWASWNTYRAEISEDIIKSQTDALIELGLDKVGYSYVNIDDGYFGGRDSEGNLISHPTKFPGGMKLHSPKRSQGRYLYGCGT